MVCIRKYKNETCFKQIECVNATKLEDEVTVCGGMEIYLSISFETQDHYEI